MAKVGDCSSLVTSFCINLALLRRIEARNLEKEPLRRVRPTHFPFDWESLGCVHQGIRSVDSKGKLVWREVS